MELKEIKCKNCGAKLKVEDRERQVTCEFCGAKFSIEDDYNKAYDRAKGLFDAQRDSFKELTKLPGIRHTRMFIIVFSIVIFGIVIALSISSVMSFNKTSRRINSNESSTNEAYSKQAKLIEIQSFNGPIELVNGKNVELLISKTLDDIITSNKKNKNHQIKVAYKNLSTNEEEGIVQIRDSLKENSYYNVSLDYDDEGYINRFTITDIEKK